MTENVSLKSYNSFGIDAYCRYFSAFENEAQLAELLTNRVNMMVLGGGSNVLFTKNFDGLILQNKIAGIKVIKEDNEHVYVKSGAGEKWNDLVNFCLEHNLAGMENMALIPGSVGASPMQNIGAYGIEVKDVFYSLEAFNIESKKTEMFSNADCAFGYRESIFKNELKGQYIITNVTFRLNRKPVFNTSYGAIEEELSRLGIEEISIQAIALAVSNIRRSKLPDPAVTGNAGSFFKNPEIPNELYKDLITKYPAMPGYPQPHEQVKIAAGWMIEQCGWKGFRRGDAGCHPKQALVLVNYGTASGEEIYALSAEIIESVYEKFGVNLTREVNII